MKVKPKPDALVSVQDFAAIMNEAENRVTVVSTHQREDFRTILGVDIRHGEWLRIELYASDEGVQMIQRLTKPTDPVQRPVVSNSIWRRIRNRIGGEK